MACSVVHRLFALVLVVPVAAFREIGSATTAANASGSDADTARVLELRWPADRLLRTVSAGDSPGGGLLQRAANQLPGGDEEAPADALSDWEVWSMYDNPGQVYLDTRNGYLGRGARSYVWPGWYQERWLMGLFNRGGQVDVAVKVLLRRRRLHESFELASAELERMRLFGPPHFVRCYGMCTCTSHVGLVQERADFDFEKLLRLTERGENGFSFEAAFNVSGRGTEMVDFEDVLTVILHGLREMDEKGFVHRDIKPTNVLFVWDAEARRHRVVLGDLASSCAPGPQAGPEAANFDCASFSGNLEYLAPEIWRQQDLKVTNNKIVLRSFMPTHKHDVFAAAVTILNAKDLAWGAVVRSILAGKDKEEDDQTGLVEDAAAAMAAALVLDGRPVAKVLAQMVQPNPDLRCTAEQCLRSLASLRSVW